MGRPAIYFTTDAPRACRRVADIEGLYVTDCGDDNHSPWCPMHCGARARADRFGNAIPGSELERTSGDGDGAYWPRHGDTGARVVCHRDHDHEGEHAAQSTLGGYTVEW